MLIGNSGGASLFTFYLHQAHAPAGDRLTHTAAGDGFDLNRFDLPGADAMVYLAGHAGEGHYLLHAIDPSVVDEPDPVACDPDARPLRRAQRVRGATGRAAVRRPSSSTGTAPRNGRGWSASTHGRASWWPHAGPHAPRGPATPAPPRDRRAAIATTFMTVYRTDADPRAVDRSLDPSARDYGSIWGRRPDWINYGAVGFGRVVSPEAWLSTWSGLVVAGRDRDHRAAG